MIIETLILSNFRSYSKKVFSFSPTTTIIIGDNAVGKTNLLEAIFSLATGGSFRTESDREMIEFGKELGRVNGVIKQLGNEVIKGKEEEINLEIVVTRGEVMGIKAPIKKYSVNGVGKRMVDFIGTLKVVLFWPEDLELVTDSPSLRRRYLDSVLIQVDREYRRSLISYEKGIRMRNKVLEAIRDRGAHRHQLLFWDQLLIKTGEYITKKREEYIDFLNQTKNLEPRTQNMIYRIIYEKSIISRDRLDQYAQEEVAAGVTLVGPHRDDFEFRITSNAPNPPLTLRGGEEELRDLSHFGSRGEQRLGVLWLKLGELAYIEEICGEKPVLLLDDIFSELDHEHRKIIFAVIGNQQTIMTTTDEHFIENKLLKSPKIIRL